MLQNSFSFEGRARRLTYGISMLIVSGCWLVYYFIVLAIAMSATPDGPGNGAGAFLVILFIALAIPATWFQLAAGARRCHDINLSGWFQLIPFFGLVLLFVEGNGGDNRFGSNPKSPALQPAIVPQPTSSRDPIQPPLKENPSKSRPMIWDPNDLIDEVKQDDQWTRQFGAVQSATAPQHSNPPPHSNTPQANTPPPARTGKTGPYKPGSLNQEYGQL